MKLRRIFFLARLLCSFGFACAAFSPGLAPADSDPASDALQGKESPGTGWPTYGGDPGGRRYSPLVEISPANVADLEVAWTYRTGESSGEQGRADSAVEGKTKTAFQATPILLGDTLYFCTPLSQLIAIGADSGEERWRFDANPNIAGDMTKTCRGVAIWQSERGKPDGFGNHEAGDPGEATMCETRVFMGTIDAGLVAVDGQTGRACGDFGTGGRVDLTSGMGKVEPGEMYMTSPPTVVGDVVITGAMVRDNERVASPGGVIRAFDVRSGRLRWA